MRATLELEPSNDADAMLAAAAARTPDDLGVAIDWAQSATRLGRWDEAERRWATVAERFPAHRQGFFGAARLERERGRLAEADARFAALVERFPDDLHACAEWAELADRRGDAAVALRRFAEVEARFAHATAGSSGKARVLAGMGREEEADTWLAAAADRFPNDLGLLVECAESAVRRGDWEVARRRWARIAGRFPDRPVGLLGGARTLRRCGRPRDALALLAEATERFPSDPQTWIDWAATAAGVVEAEDAWLRWAEIRRRFPARWEGYAMPAGLPGCEARGEEIEALLAEARGRFPNQQDVFQRSAEAAEARGDWDAAAGHYADLIARFPPSASIAAAHARVRLRLDPSARADAAPDRIAEDGERLLARIGDALQSGDAAEAAQQWRSLHAAAGGDPAIRLALQKLRWRLLEFGTDPHSGDATAAEWTIGTIVQQFESLGGMYHGCEFGILQRAHGAEPLGLLRWSNVAPKRLIQALTADFAGVGNPDQTTLTLTPKGEYITNDARFGMPTHTFVSASEVSHEQMMRRATTRLRFLRRKLLEDLTAPEKVYLYKFGAGPLPDEEAQALGAALGRHGPATLLCVRLATESDPFPTVRWLGPRLMVGHMDRFSVKPDGTHYGSVHDSWEAVIRNAFALWRTARTA